MRHEPAISHNISRLSRLSRLSFLLLLLPLAAGLVGCDHRPLVDPIHTHYLRVYIDEQIPNVTTDYYDSELVLPAVKSLYQRPHTLRALLFDPYSGRLVAERYLREQGEDNYGYYLEGYIQCPPGEYTLMVYNFGTESAIVRGETNLFTLEAYTSQVTFEMGGFIPKSESNDINRVWEPDLLFLVNCQTFVKPGYVIDTLCCAGDNTPTGISVKKTASKASKSKARSGSKSAPPMPKSACAENPFIARSVTDAYYVQIQLNGVQYLRSVHTLLCGVHSGLELYTLAPNQVASAISFDMPYGHVEDTRATLYATFKTFGGIEGRHSFPVPGTAPTLTFYLLNVGDQIMKTTLDITEELQTARALNHRWIIIEKTIEIPEPEEGSGDDGFHPTVSNWEDVSTIVLI